jgi:hypothetical protein
MGIGVAGEILLLTLTVSTLTFTGGRTNVRALIRGQLALGASMITRATTWLGLTERGATTVNAYEGVAAPAAEAKASPIPAARKWRPLGLQHRRRHRDERRCCAGGGGERGLAQEELRDLDRVRGSSLAQLIADHPEVQAGG